MPMRTQFHSRTPRVATREIDGGNGGPILLRATNITLNKSTLSSDGRFAPGGSITLVSSRGLDIQGSVIQSGEGTTTGQGGTVDLTAGTGITLTNTGISAGGAQGGSITLTAPIILLRGSALGVDADGGPAGLVRLTGAKAVSLSDSALSARGHIGPSGTVEINGGAKFTSQQSSIDAGNDLFHPGGTIDIKADKIRLTDTQVTSSGAGILNSGGSITMEAKKNLTFNNSQILSTAVLNGPGGTINIRSPRFHQDAISVIDASSQFGTNGTVTINGVIQP